jgi:hypothetical protein
LAIGSCTAKFASKPALVEETVNSIETKKQNKKSLFAILCFFEVKVKFCSKTFQCHLIWSTLTPPPPLSNFLFGLPGQKSFLDEILANSGVKTLKQFG